MADKILADEVVITSIATSDYLQTVVGGEVRRILLTDAATKLNLDGSIFRGEATPAGTPDIRANVIYVANQTGTYTNYGGLVVGDLEVSFLYYNGSWSKINLINEGGVLTGDLDADGNEINNLAMPTSPLDGDAVNFKRLDSVSSVFVNDVYLYTQAITDTLVNSIKSISIENYDFKPFAVNLLYSDGTSLIFNLKYYDGAAWQDAVYSGLLLQSGIYSYEYTSTAYGKVTLVVDMDIFLAGTGMNHAPADLFTAEFKTITKYNPDDNFDELIDKTQKLDSSGDINADISINDNEITDVVIDEMDSNKTSNAANLEAVIKLSHTNNIAGDLVVGEFIVASTGGSTVHADYGRTDYIKVEEGQSILYIGEVVASSGIAGYSISRGYTTNILDGLDSVNLKVFWFTIPSGVHYIRACAKFVEPQILIPSKTTDLFGKRIMSSNNIDFNIAAGDITLTNVRMLFGTSTVLLNETIDISSLTSSVHYALMYNFATLSLETIYQNNFDMPYSSILIATFRKDNNSIYGLSHYNIDGESYEPRSSSGALMEDKYIIDSDIDSVFETNVVLPENNSAIYGSTSAEIYTMYDALVTAYPDYITRTLLGNEGSASAYPIYKYDFNPIKPNDSVTSKTTKVIFDTGIHGNEKTGVWTLYEMMNNICNNWDEDSLLEALRFNIHFVIVPIVNPWGFNETPSASRINHNGVDLNRNFTTGWNLSSVGPYYSGTAPLTENESIIINQLMDDNSDAIIYVGGHNYDVSSDDYSSFWIPVYDNLGVSIAKTIIQKVDRMWKGKYTAVSADFDVFKGTTSKYGGATGEAYATARAIHGIKFSYTSEYCSRVYDGTPTPSAYNTSDTLTMAYEVHINVLLSFLNRALMEQYK